MTVNVLTQKTNSPIERILIIKIESCILELREEEGRKHPEFISEITRNKYDPCFINHKEASIFAAVMECHAVARNANKKMRLRIKEALKRAPICGEFQWLIERILECDYMQAWFYAEDYGSHCFCLKTYSTDDTCYMFEIDTETLYAAKCCCESVLNEAKNKK